MANCNRIGDSPVLVAECEAIREAIIMVHRMSIHKAWIYSLSGQS